VPFCLIFKNIFEPRTLRTIDPSDYRPFGPMTLRTNEPSDQCPGICYIEIIFIFRVITYITPGYWG
jgi:hypothetical protein